MGNGWKRRALEGENEKGWEKKDEKTDNGEISIFITLAQKTKKIFLLFENEVGWAEVCHKPLGAAIALFRVYLRVRAYQSADWL